MSNVMKFPPMNNDSTLTIIKESLKDSFGYEGRSIKKYGNVYQFKIFGTLFYSISDPDCMKHILLDNMWNYHRPTRGAFSHEAFVEYCGNRNNLRHTVDPIYWKKSGEAVAPVFMSKEYLQKYAFYSYKHSSNVRIME